MVENSIRPWALGAVCFVVILASGMPAAAAQQCTLAGVCAFAAIGYSGVGYEGFGHHSAPVSYFGTLDDRTGDEHDECEAIVVSCVTEVTGALPPGQCMTVVVETHPLDSNMTWAGMESELLCKDPDVGI